MHRAALLVNTVDSLTECEVHRNREQVILTHSVVVLPLFDLLKCTYSHNGDRIMGIQRVC